MPLNAGEVNAVLVDRLPDPNLGANEGHAQRTSLAGGKPLDVDAVAVEGSGSLDGTRQQAVDASRSPSGELTNALPI